MRFGNPLALVSLLIALLPWLAGAASAQTVNNRTILFHELNHGTQIAHLAANGRVFLWYPGNRGVVSGRWRTEGRGAGRRMCFLYGSQSRNPVTGRRGGSWRCNPFGHFWRGVKHSCAGDAFSLSSGRVPFVLPRRTNEIGRLRKVCR